MISKEEMESIGFKQENERLYTMYPNDGIVSVDSSPPKLKIVVSRSSNKYCISHVVYIDGYNYPAIVYTGEIENIDRMKSILNHTIVPRGSLYDK